MKDLKVTIEGKEYPLEQEVFDLIHTISLERDGLRDNANQRVIEELELIVKEINSFTATNRIEKRLLKTIEELKQ